MRFNSLSVAVSLSMAVFVNSVMAIEATYEGPESIPLFHPLCLQPLKNAQDNGGAFDMDECLTAHADIEVKRTPDGGYFAKRPVDLEGTPQGYVVYKPIGTLDRSMELLLVHDKSAGSEFPDASVYVIGRLPGTPSGRDFLTRIEAQGNRCNGGIQSARLVSEAILEVDLNVNPATLMSLLKPGFEQTGTTRGKGGLSTLSLKPISMLDNRPTTCIGTLTKTYDLIKNKESYAWVKFFKEGTLIAVEPYQQCFDQLVKDFVKPPSTLSIPEFEVFAQLLEDECKKIK